MLVVEGGPGSFSPAPSFMSPRAFSRHIRLKISLIRTSFHFSDITEWPACRHSAITRGGCSFYQCGHRGAEPGSCLIDSMAPQKQTPGLQASLRRQAKQGGLPVRFRGVPSLQAVHADFCTEARLCRKKFAPTTFAEATSPAPGPRVQ